MTLSDATRMVLPLATQRAWERLLPVIPGAAYLVGGTAIAVHLEHRQSRDLDFFLEEAVDLGALAGQIAEIGPFVATDFRDDTLNGVFDEAKVQFVLADSQQILEPLTTVDGLRVAGIGDLLATKLKDLQHLGELRDYFDIMTIEREAGRRVEEGLALFVERYRPDVEDAAVVSIIRSLGYFGDVTDDLQLPTSRQAIEHYWQRRQPEIIRNLGWNGV